MIELTSEPIPFANIYFNNSLNGTVSDIDGYFKLDIASNSGQEVVISSTGYETYLLQDYISGGVYEIYLKEKVTLLKEVEVYDQDPLSREFKLEIFKREFFGMGLNAKNCAIENEDELKLVYIKSEDAIYAFSDVPLLIINEKLGYKIQYDLVAFRYVHDKILSYRGYSRFQELPGTTKFQRSINRRRKKALTNSRMEFFRLLWKDELSYSRMKVYDRLGTKEIDLSQYVSSENAETKFLNYRGHFRIISGSNVTQVVITKSRILFNENGYFDPDGITWSGYMSQKRISDLVPYEYNPANK